MVWLSDRWRLPWAALVAGVATVGCLATLGCQEVWGIESIEEGPAQASGLKLCSELGLEPVIVYGSDSVPPVLEQIGPRLADDGVAYLVYLYDRSCNAVDTVYGNKPKKGEAACYYPKSGDGMVHGEECGEFTCIVDGLVDVGVSDVFPQTCGAGDTASVIHKSGPIQAAIFVTARRSSQSTITLFQARTTYHPSDGGIVAEPWHNPAYVLQRTPESGTQRLMATLMGFDPSQPMAGRSFESSSDLIAEIERLDADSDLSPDDLAGVVGIYDVSNRDKRYKEGSPGFKTLAFHMTDEALAVTPDEHLFDKANVRNGQYVIWSPLHFVWRSDISDPSHLKKVTSVVEAITLDEETSTPKDLVQVFTTWVNRAFVPDCAMQYHRDTEMGPLIEQSSTCTCAFEQALGETTLPDGCTPCEDISDCGPGFFCDPFGYCEPIPQQ